MRDAGVSDQNFAVFGSIIYQINNLIYKDDDQSIMIAVILQKAP